MDWNSILDILIKALGSAAATVVITLASILFAKLKSKIGDAKINAYIDKCVKAAEQLFPNLGNKTGKEKYEYVKNLVLEKFPGLRDTDHLKALIEGAVYTVSEQVKQIQEANKTTTTTDTLKSF